MNPTLDAALRSWPFDPWLIFGLAASAAVYLRGWRILRRRDPGPWPHSKLFAFLGGLGLIFLALGSPIEPFSAFLLQVHMLQHLLLMMAAPPLIWLGTPLFPLLRGLPRPIRTAWAIPLLRSPMLREFFTRLTQPLAAWTIYVAMTWLWHIPALYGLALASPGWHYVQHVCFLAAALLFWYPVIRPYPARPAWSLWWLLPYLLLADVQNTLLSALLTFSTRVIYPHYAEMPRLGGGSALDDQAAAGVLMWVPGSVAFLAPLFWIGLRLMAGESGAVRSTNERRHFRGELLKKSPSGVFAPLSPCGRGAGGEGSRQIPTAAVAEVSTAPSAGPSLPLTPNPSPARGEGEQTTPPSPRWRGNLVAELESLHKLGAKGDAGATRRIALPMARPGPLDLLNVPLLGRFLRWRNARLCFQLPLLLLAIAVAYDGFVGPQVSPLNLAGVLPWIHWRGFLIFGLLVLGNVFCLACPFMLPRRVGRMFGFANRTWPRALRNKWLAVVLVAVFLWAYEAFALWDRPLATAWIIVAYFLSAFVVDSFFRGAAFCKYVCPIGQFNFVQSLVSPVEIQVRDPAVCESCSTKDCIRGRDGIPGCEMRLFQPRKSSNLDCTFCLDCVHACPHDNIAVAAVMPGAELIRDPQRSGIGRFSRRRDLAALIYVLTFGAFVNAGMMTAPVVARRDAFVGAVGCHPLDATTLAFIVGLGVIPMLGVGAAAAICRSFGDANRPLIDIATRFAPSFVPLGFAMWLSHYSFHLLTSFASFAPAAARFLGDLGIALSTFDDWSGACCAPSAAWLLKLEITFLNFGLLGSLDVARRIAKRLSSTRIAGIILPWAMLLLALWLCGIWILFQPMEMRGTM